MAEIFQALVVLLGLIGSRIADPGDVCGPADCPAVPTRPVVAWAAPQDVRADEVRLFSRGDRRPGQPGPDRVVACPSSTVEGGPVRYLLIGPARDRLAPKLTTRAQVVVTVHRAGSAR